jgi:hydroxymethylglutaryl-CoA lyase
MTQVPLNLPDRVMLADCWARDGLQNEPSFVATEAKVAVLDELIDAGFQQVEAVSFSSPKSVPQFRDAEDVLRRITRREGVMIRCITPNMRGLERAIDCTQAGAGVDAIGFPLSASEVHNVANVNRTHEQAKPELEQLARRAKAEGFDVVGSVSTAFGCPIVGDVPRDKVLELVAFFRDIGVDWLMLGDTTGMANPRQAFELLTLAMMEAPDLQWIGHFHDTRGSGLANCIAAMQAGITSFDCSLGGLGGQPAGGQHRYHTGLTGNVCTEDLAHMLVEMDIETGIDLEKLLEAGLLAEEAVGRQARSQVLRTGSVHHPVASLSGHVGGNEQA